jgi:hypothetical protein
MGIPDPLEALDQAAAVYSGEVVSNEPTWVSGHEPSLEIDVLKFELPTTESMLPYRKLTFKVDKSWKGVTEERVVALTPSGDPACSLDFQLGRRYLVYAGWNEKDEVYLVWCGCGRTSPIEAASEDFKALPPPKFDFDAERERRSSPPGKLVTPPPR